MSRRAYHWLAPLLLAWLCAFGTRAQDGSERARAEASFRAGAAAYAAQQNRMYQFADLFYRHQGPENSDYADSAFIRGIAGQVQGLDPEKAAAAANDPLSWPAVRAGEQFARNLGSTGTPDFYVRKGGRLRPLNVQGATPDDYARALDAALGRT